MLKCDFTLKGASPIGFSRAIQSTRNTGESHDSFEERTWREKAHTKSDGTVFIPPMAVKNMLAEVAKHLSESVPGKGKATYTKHFLSGILVTEELSLGVKINDVPSVRLFLPSDGIKGSGKRVWKTFPVLQDWRCDGSLYLLDPILIAKPQKVEEYMRHAGKFIGLGWFRPARGGYYGRFEVTRFVAEKAV